MRSTACFRSKSIFFAGLIFLVLAIFAHYYAYLPLDLAISQKLQILKQPWFHNLMWLVSLPGNTNVLPITLGFILAILLMIKHRLGLITCIVGVATSVSLSAFIKALVHRPRPSASLVTVYDHLTDMSFPSSHTLSYTLILGFLIYLSQTEIRSKTLKTISSISFSLLIILVGLSRIYLGVHWFSDVLGGYLLGFICLHYTICLYRHFKLHSI